MGADDGVEVDELPGLESRNVACGREDATDGGGAGDQGGGVVIAAGVGLLEDGGDVGDYVGDEGADEDGGWGQGRCGEGGNLGWGGGRGYLEGAVGWWDWG